MPAPTQATYSVAALVAAHTAFRDLLDSHATLPGAIKVRDAAGVLLGTITLADPSGTVNGTTGQLTFATTTRDESADAAGTIAYVEICDGGGDVHLALPAQAGSAPVSGKAVFNTLTVVVAGPLEITSVTVG
jgi:hypothetical protein